MHTALGALRRAAAAAADGGNGVGGGGGVGGGVGRGQGGGAGGGGGGARAEGSGGARADDDRALAETSGRGELVNSERALSHRTPAEEARPPFGMSMCCVTRQKGAVPATGAFDMPLLASMMLRYLPTRLDGSSSFPFARS